MIARILLALLSATLCISAYGKLLAETRRIANESGTDWPSYGRTYREQFFSPLKMINKDNVATLGLSWSLDLPGAQSLEATPLMVNGVLYFTTDNSIVYAVDARSGKQLWRFDPEVWRHAGKRYRNLFNVNRGVAFWKGRVFLGSFDGRLIALDARTGSKVWEVQTLDEFPTGYITGAPRVFNDKVIIGQGGAETGPSRGFVSAYDTQTGKKLWRFHVVPGNPADGFENRAMAAAAKTWTGEWWKYGGGGTVWNSMTYDPEMNRVYIGTGNGSPWNQKIRSPGGGDNLYLCSIVALDADSGDYLWHYQTVPGESWDYNSNMDITLTDLKIDGKARKVMLHAPKNGFLYVIDRSSGKLISAEKIGKVTWAEKIDLATGRPVENPEARAPNGTALIYPGSPGVHNWQPMSFNPGTGLLYIPTLEMPGYYDETTIDKKSWKMQPNSIKNTGYEAPAVDVGDKPGEMKFPGFLLAWDPVRQRKVWEVLMPGPWNGGVLSTAGNLVFHGNAGGEFAAYDAASGNKLWSMNAGLGIISAPITYQLDNKQYVAVLVGWGGVLPAAFGAGAAYHGWAYGRQPRRLLTFALNDHAQLPPTAPPQMAMPVDDPELVIDPAEVKAGREVFNAYCPVCHGLEAIGGGATPDLRTTAISLKLDAFRSIVRDGAMLSTGMPMYDELSDKEIRQMFMYVRQRARDDLAKINAPAAAKSDPDKDIKVPPLM